MSKGASRLIWLLSRPDQSKGVSSAKADMEAKRISKSNRFMSKVPYWVETFINAVPKLAT